MARVITGFRRRGFGDPKDFVVEVKTQWQDVLRVESRSVKLRVENDPEMKTIEIILPRWVVEAMYIRGRKTKIDNTEATNLSPQ